SVWEALGAATHYSLLNIRSIIVLRYIGLFEVDRRRRRLLGRLRGIGIPAAGEPHVIDGMLDCIQARTFGEHPTGKNSFGGRLLQLVDLHEGRGLRFLGDGTGVADARANE